MGRARASIDLASQVSAAEALWYDTRRWPTFVDGFKAVVKAEGDWPHEGAHLQWESVPAGRGRVAERVVAYEVRRGQTVAVEDAKLTGTQTVAFAPRQGGGCTMELDFTWRLKQQHPLSPVLDLFFVRRAFNDALRRTLARFARELRAEEELGS